MTDQSNKNGAIEELLALLAGDGVLSPRERMLVRDIVTAAAGDATSSSVVRSAVSTALGKRISESLGSALLSRILSAPTSRPLGGLPPIRPPIGPILGSPGSPTNPGNPPGPPGSPTNPGNPPGPPGSPTNPGNPPGPPGSPTNPGNPPGPPGSPTNPGNPPGPPGSPTNPGNPPGPPGSPTNPGNPGGGYVLNPFGDNAYTLASDNFLMATELAAFESFVADHIVELEAGVRTIVAAGSGSSRIAEHSFMMSANLAPLLGRLTSSLRMLLLRKVPPAAARAVESARVQAALVGCKGANFYRSVDLGFPLSRRDIGFVLDLTPRSSGLAKQTLSVRRGAASENVTLRLNTLVLFKGDAIAASVPNPSRGSRGIALAIAGRLFT